MDALLEAPEKTDSQGVTNARRLEQADLGGLGPHLEDAVGLLIDGGGGQDAGLHDLVHQRLRDLTVGEFTAGVSLSGQFFQFHIIHLLILISG